MITASSEIYYAWLCPWNFIILQCCRHKWTYKCFGAYRTAKKKKI